MDFTSSFHPSCLHPSGRSVILILARKIIISAKLLRYTGFGVLYIIVLSVELSFVRKVFCFKFYVKLELFT